MNRSDVPAWFFSHVMRGEDDECWTWDLRHDRDGYGLASWWEETKNVTAKVHRLAYELLVGPIPDGYQLDHTCHTKDLTCPGGRTCPHRGCVNPAHLEPVTNLENHQRGRSNNRRKTHCPKGHPYDGFYSTHPHRYCKTCRRERWAIAAARRLAGGA